MTQENNPLMRVRLTYQRLAGLRYISHLDMHQVWERTFRRAGLPLAYSRGFSPHPRLHLASALPLGFLSRCEIVDAWLETQVDETQIVERVQAAVPPGLVIERVETVSLQEPALQTQVQSAEYLARLLDPVDVEQLRQTISNLLSADHLPRERRGKEYDLRPLIEELVLHPGDEHNDQPILFMRLTAREGATGRPEEVLAALGLDSTAARIERTGLNLA